MRSASRYFTVMMAIAGILIAAPAFAADTYDLDPVHCTFLFKIKHLNVSYTYGRFDESSGTFRLDADNPTNNYIAVEVKTASIDTAVEDRDKHLRSPEFFDVQAFPTMSFESTSFKKIDDKHFEVTGNLTIHGVTKSVTTTAELVGIGKGMKGETRAGLETVFTIDRTDFGMNTMVGPVGADVELTVSVEGIRR